MLICIHIVFKTISCVTLNVIFVTKASIICLNSGTCNTIRVPVALTIQFFDISINRSTPSYNQLWHSSYHSGLVLITGKTRLSHSVDTKAIEIVADMLYSS